MATEDDASAPSIVELLDRFLAERAARTERAYTADLDDFAAWRGRSRADVVAELLGGGPEQGRRLASTYAAQLRHRGRALATIDRRLQTLHSLVGMARGQGLIEWSLELAQARAAAADVEQVSDDVAYVLPRHSSEVDRLDLQHYALAQQLGAHYLAPVHGPARVLDVGAGTGQWGYDVCRQFPEALVVGFDLTPPKPGAPPGYRAVLGNLLHGLPFAGDCFDLVHQRLMFSGVPVEAWPTAVRDLVRACRPGGWIELVEGATRFEPCGPATDRLTGLLVQLNRTTGLDTDSVVFESVDRYLADAGVLEVARRTVAMPMGEWAGKIGSLMASDVRALFTRVSAVFTARLGVPAAECMELVRAAQLEWEQHHTTYSLAFAWGRKAP